MLKNQEIFILVKTVRKSDKNCCLTFLHKLAQHTTTLNRNDNVQGKVTVTNSKDGLYFLILLFTLHSKHRSLPIPPTSVGNDHNFMLLLPKPPYSQDLPTTSKTLADRNQDRHSWLCHDPVLTNQNKTPMKNKLGVSLTSC